MDGVDTRLNITLPPPDGSGDQYTDLAVKATTGKPVGDDDANSQTLSTNLKTVFGDDIESLAEAEDVASQFNINLQIGGSITKAKAAMQQELDTLDPSNPRVPILTKYIDVCDQLLQDGNIPGVDITLGQDADGNVQIQLDADNVNATADASAVVGTHVTAHRTGNPWLRGNAYVAFIVNFLTLAKLMMENMMVESKAEIASLQMMYELGDLAAKQIRTAGEKAAEMHRIAAYTAMVAAVTIAATTLMSLKSMANNKLEAEPPGDKSYTPINPKKPPPDLNIRSQPILDSNGVPKQVDVPKYIEFKGKIYRNKGEPPGSPGFDKRGYPYLESGRSPVQLSPQSEKLGITGVNPQYNKITGKEVHGYIASDPPYTKKAPAYEQLNVNVETRKIPVMDNKTGKQVMEEVPDPNNPGQSLIDPKTGKPQLQPKTIDDTGESITRDRRDIAKDNEIKSAKLQKTTMIAQATREFITQTSKTVEEFMKVQLEIEKSQAEAFKEILSTLQRLIGHAMDKASEGIKANNDLFAQIIQQLDAIRAKLMEAISAAYKKGSG